MRRRYSKVYIDTGSRGASNGREVWTSLMATYRCKTPLSGPAAARRDTEAGPVPTAARFLCGCLFCVALSVEAGSGGEENTTDVPREETYT